MKNKPIHKTTETDPNLKNALMKIYLDLNIEPPDDESTPTSLTFSDDEDTDHVVQQPEKTSRTKPKNLTRKSRHNLILKLMKNVLQKKWLLILAILFAFTNARAQLTLVKDINTVDNVNSSPTEFCLVGSVTFFVATDHHGAELWKTDGTEAGTVMVKDIYPGTTSSWPSGLINSNGTLFFRVNDGTNGIELWKSDGTEAGTVMVKDINPGSASSSPFSLMVIGEVVYFVAYDGTNGSELWKSDGTEAGTMLVKDIVSGSGTSSPNSLTNVNGTLFFIATDATNGRELWKSDGTEAGTVIVKDCTAGAGNSNFSSLTVYDDMLYFLVNETLWKSDGTEAGTVKIENPANTFYSEILAVSNNQLFCEVSNESGKELWKYVAPKPEIGVKQGTTAIVDETGSYDFGSKKTNTNIAFTIENTGAVTSTLGSFTITGTNADQFSWVGTNPTTIASGSTTDVTVSFTPTSSGAKVAIVSFANEDADENPYNFTITETGTVPEINVKQGTTAIADAGSFDFGNIKQGSNSGDITFTIENTGTADLNLTGSTKAASPITISGTNAADFTVVQTALTPTVAPSGTTTFTIKFTPAAAGARTAEIRIANDDADENPYNFTITGTGTVPEINVKQGTTAIADAGTYDFGNIKQGSNSGDITFTIENTGTADLALGGSGKASSPITISGTNAADFTVVQTALTPTVAPSGTTTFTIKFTPAAAGARTAEIRIANDDADENPYNFTITGTGTVPEINVKQGTTAIADGGTYDFGSINTGSNSGDITFTIENNGTANLNLTGTPKVEISGANAADFTIVQTAVSSTIAASGTTTFTIKFTPAAAGARTAEISIANDDADENPYNFTINGTGIFLSNTTKIVASSLISNNDDGINDVWVVKNVELVKDFDLTIYNNIGALIYKTTDYQNDWEAKYQGNPLPAGIYYYIFAKDGQYYKGTITVAK